MSLDFNFAGMIERLGQKEFDRIASHPKDPDKFHPVTNELIWTTMLIGVPSLTEKTADLFVSRLYAFQAVNGPSFTCNGDQVLYVTERDVRAHIGMYTNASRYTDGQFGKALVNRASEVGRKDAERQAMSAFDAIQKAYDDAEET